MQAIGIGFFSVDSFFFLSGVLVAYLTLREMERRRGRFPFLTYYLHRYLRLTMVYAFLLFFWWTLTVYLGSGPLWQSSAGPRRQACSKYWWTNLLYINNFYPWKLGDECMGWSWYLANDMQFFVLAPLVLIPLYHFFPIGLAISGFLLSLVFVANGTIAGINKFPANMLLPDHTNAGELDDIYVKPYCRAAPYIVGIVLGFLLYKKFHVNVHWLADWAIYCLLWVIAAGCCFSTVYGLYDVFHRKELTLAQNVSYIMFSRCVWAVGLALIVFACHNGYGWVVNDFLSMKFWIPLSRLCYTAYLVHPIVLTVAISTIRGTVGYTDNIIAVFAVAMVVLSFGAAGVVAVFVEFPLSNLEMAVFKAVGLKPRESARHGTAQKEVALSSTPPVTSKNIHN
jgi:peptidoglycan/LPS O-acetylase OafA/YrhL